MSEGRRCVCERLSHHPARRPSSLPPEWQVDEPGTCSRYAVDELGGLCRECATGFTLDSPASTTQTSEHDLNRPSELELARPAGLEPTTFRSAT